MDCVQLLCCCKGSSKSQDSINEILVLGDEKKKMLSSVLCESPTYFPPTFKETVYASPFVSVQVMTTGDDAKFIQNKDHGIKTSVGRVSDTMKDSEGGYMYKGIKALEQKIEDPTPSDGGTSSLPWSRFDLVEVRTFPQDESRTRVSESLRESLKVRNTLHSKNSIIEAT
jgi:hypothetical protein